MHKVKTVYTQIKNNIDLYMDVRYGRRCLKISKLGAEATSEGSLFHILMVVGMKEKR